MPPEDTKADLPSDVGLHGTIEALENHHAVIRTADDQRLLVAHEHLPNDIHVGESVVITISTKHSEEQGQKKMARALLNEILNPEP